MGGKNVISVNGVEYEAGPCRHCGASASDADAVRAVEEWNGPRPSCAVCGAVIGMIKVALEHCVPGGGGTWKARLICYRDCLALTAVGGGRIYVHQTCVRAAMPHTDWLSVEWLGCFRTSYSEERRKRMPWDPPQPGRSDSHGLLES